MNTGLISFSVDPLRLVQNEMQEAGVLSRFPPFKAVIPMGVFEQFSKPADPQKILSLQSV
jgi:hypothetical protein